MAQQFRDKGIYRYGEQRLTAFAEDNGSWTFAPTGTDDEPVLTVDAHGLAFGYMSLQPDHDLNFESDVLIDTGETDDDA